MCDWFFIYLSPKDEKLSRPRRNLSSERSDGRKPAKHFARRTDDSASLLACYSFVFYAVMTTNSLSITKKKKKHWSRQRFRIVFGLVNTRNCEPTFSRYIIQDEWTKNTKNIINIKSRIKYHWTWRYVYVVYFCSLFRYFIIPTYKFYYQNEYFRSRNTAHFLFCEWSECVRLRNLIFQ